MRSVLAWVLTSPVRLALVVVLIVGISLGAALLGARDYANRGVTAPSSAAHDHSAGPGAASTDSGLASDQPPEEKAPSSNLTRPTVDQFLAGYLGATKKKDLRTLRPIITSQLWEGLRLSDPKSLPAGPATRITATSLGAYAATYDVATPTTTLSVSVVLEPDGWKVNDVEPNHTPAAP